MRFCIFIFACCTLSWDGLDTFALLHSIPPSSRVERGADASTSTSTSSFVNPK